MSCCHMHDHMVSCMVFFADLHMAYAYACMVIIWQRLHGKALNSVSHILLAGCTTGTGALPRMQRFSWTLRLVKYGRVWTCALGHARQNPLQTCLVFAKFAAAWRPIDAVSQRSLQE